MLTGVLPSLAAVLHDHDERLKEFDFLLRKAIWKSEKSETCRVSMRRVANSVGRKPDLSLLSLMTNATGMSSLPTWSWLFINVQSGQLAKLQ